VVGKIINACARGEGDTSQPFDIDLSRIDKTVSHLGWYYELVQVPQGIVETGIGAGAYIVPVAALAAFNQSAARGCCINFLLTCSVRNRAGAQ